MKIILSEEDVKEMAIGSLRSRGILNQGVVYDVKVRSYGSEFFTIEPKVIKIETEDKEEEV